MAEVGGGARVAGGMGGAADGNEVLLEARRVSKTCTYWHGTVTTGPVEIEIVPAETGIHTAFANVEGEAKAPISNAEHSTYADRLIERRKIRQSMIESQRSETIAPPPIGPETSTNIEAEAKTPISSVDRRSFEDRLRERRQSVIESRRARGMAPPPLGYREISLNNLPLEMAVKAYGELIGRSVWLSPSSGNRSVNIKASRLTDEEAIRVHEIAFDLLGLRIEKDAEQAVRIFPKEPAIHVRLVAAEKPKWEIFDMEMPTREPLEEATCLARGASVDGTNTFDRYEQDKYFTRTSNLTLDPAKVGAGEHAIEPGHHVFLVEEDGTLSSTDPDIIVDGQTVSLKTHRIEILQRHPDMSGPLGLYLPPPGFDAAKDPFDAARAMNLLSHSRKLTALRVYLPANTIGNGYLLTPSMQAFHVRAGGTVEFQGTPAPGLKAEGSRILLP